MIPDLDALRRERSGVIRCKTDTVEIDLDLIGDAWGALNDLLAGHEQQGRVVAQAGKVYEVYEGAALICTMEVLWMREDT